LSCTVQHRSQLSIEPVTGIVLSPVCLSGTNWEFPLNLHVQSHRAMLVNHNIQVTTPLYVNFHSVSWI
jgi:hypothetical protein